MEKIDRELLIKEISTRLPYGIKVRVFGWDEEKGEVAVPLKVYSINTDGYISLEYNHYDVESVYIEDCLLYLRPMSSMTEEEKKEMHEKLSPTGTAIYKEEGISTPLNHYGDWIPYEYMSRIIDWLNAHHFDYRGLIEMGLAIAVTKENNPYED